MRSLTVITAVAVSLSAATALAAEGGGEAMAVIDTASVSGLLGERKLTVGSKIFVGDLVATDAVGEVQLLFSDGTRMVVGSNSSLMIDELRFGADANGNRFAIRALAGSFRFISGDSGDRGYSIRTPSATIGVRGTVFDFTVTPEGETKLVLLEGEATLCSESGEGGEGEDCKTVATPCALLQTEPGEDVEEIEAGKRRVQETRTHFPYLTSQSSLLEEFRIGGLRCAVGGVAQFVLEEQAIRRVGKIALGIATGAAIFAAIIAATAAADSNACTNC